MTIRALTLAQRALTLDARGHAPYALRFLLVGVMLLALFMAREWGSFMGAPGLHLFGWLIFTNFWFVSVFGISTFAAVVAEEKENMTLGLLKMAGFAAPSILIGKSVGQLTTMVMLLLVQLPFPLLAITLGGVSRHQVFAAYVALLAHLAFVYGLSLLCSVVAARTAAAARTAGVLLLTYYVLPWVLAMALWRANAAPGATPPEGDWLLGAAIWLSDNNAWSALGATVMTGFDEPLFAKPVIVSFVLAGALCVAAALAFGPCTRNEVAAAPSRGFLSDLVQRGRKRPFSRPVGNPLLWKDYRFLSGGLTGLTLRLCVYVALLAALRLLIPDMRTHDFGQTVVTLSFLVLLLDIGLQAGRVFREEITWRTLPTLMLLPMPRSQWMYAKVVGCLAITLPSLACLAFGAMLVPDAVNDFLRHVVGSPIGWYMFSMIVLGAHLTVLLSLRLRRGAFAIAILLLFLGNVLLGLLVAGTRSGGSVEGCFGFLAVIVLVASLAMHPTIAALATQKAAE